MQQVTAWKPRALSKRERSRVSVSAASGDWIDGSVTMFGRWTQRNDHKGDFISARLTDRMAGALRTSRRKYPVVDRAQQRSILSIDFTFWARTRLEREMRAGARVKKGGEIE